MFTSVFSFLVSVVAGGFYCRGLTFLLLGGLFYDRSITFFLFCWRINRCLLLLASYKQRKGTKQVNIPSHTDESRLERNLSLCYLGTTNSWVAIISLGVP